MPRGLSTRRTTSPWESRFDRLTAGQFILPPGFGIKAKRCLSLLNDFLYCPRRVGLKEVGGVRSGNRHTVLGNVVHEHADLPGYEVAKGVALLRALPVWRIRA